MTYQQRMLFENELARIQEFCRERGITCEFENVPSPQDTENALNNLSEAERALAVTIAQHSFAQHTLGQGTMAGPTHVPAARSQFIAGRIASRRALLKFLDSGSFSVLRQKQSRLPVFPEGYVGSIAHIHSVAIAVVAPSSNFSSVGVDLEQADRVCSTGLVTRICHSQELSMGLKPIELFCLKESTYKCSFSFGLPSRSFRALRLRHTAENSFETSVDSPSGENKIQSYLLSGQKLTFTLSLIKVLP